MLFSSREPFNDDPWPWVTPTGTRGGYNEKYAHIIRHKPRPEYERSQHNPTNPILSDARTYRAERMSMNNPKGWDHVLRQFQNACGLEDTPLSNAYTKNFTLAQIAHARKVLTRLSKLT